MKLPLFCSVDSTDFDPTSDFAADIFDNSLQLLMFFDFKLIRLVDTNEIYLRLLYALRIHGFRARYNFPQGR